ncbi:MAG TPA: hypothetical protein VMS17_26570 [Gemmataceae bacterium]|nr:hypothetical protein [Gemmataceae bacterium]
MTTHRIALALTAVLTIAAAAPAEEVRGVVTHIDPDKKELVLEQRGLGARGTVLIFTLPDQTPVLFGDQPGAVSDLETGRRVRVQYDLVDERLIVRTIHVLGGPKPVVKTPEAPPIISANGDALTGVLRHIGYNDREVTIVGPGPKGANTETTAAVPPSARIVKNGQEATLDDLQEGDSATVEIEKKDGRMVAASIQVGAGAMTKAKSPLIPRLRLLLKIADQVLQQMDGNK